MRREAEDVVTVEAAATDRRGSIRLKSEHGDSSGVSVVGVGLSTQQTCVEAPQNWDVSKSSYSRWATHELGTTHSHSHLHTQPFQNL